MNDVLYFLACLLLPIVWGIVVNKAFTHWQQRSNKNHDPHGHDFQI